MPSIFLEEPPLHRAARYGDIAAMEQLVGNGADVNATTNIAADHGSFLKAVTPLMVAACSIDGANVETLRWLLDHGANLHQTSQGEVTAAWYAAGSGGLRYLRPWQVLPDHVERLRFLLDVGLDPNETAWNGLSLLIEACRVGDPARVRLLLERGVPPIPVPSEKIHADTFRSFQIPLLCAAQSGSAETVQLLLTAGADPNTQEEDGPSALGHAASSEVVRVLVAAGARINTELHSDWNDPLNRALSAEDQEDDSSGNFAVAQALLDAGWPLEATNEHGWSRLYQMAFRREADAVDFLLEKDASLAPAPNGATPLHAICWQGDSINQEINVACERIIRSLIHAGVPLNAQNNDGQSALHEAIGGDWGNEIAARVLLELGADPNISNNAGETPIHWAVHKEELFCIRALMASGADPTLRDNEGFTARDYAQQNYDTWVRIVAQDSDSPPEDQQRHREALEEHKQILDALTPAQ